MGAGEFNEFFLYKFIANVVVIIMFEKFGKYDKLFFAIKKLFQFFENILHDELFFIIIIILHTFIIIKCVDVSISFLKSIVASGEIDETSYDDSGEKIENISFFFFPLIFMNADYKCGSCFLNKVIKFGALPELVLRHVNNTFNNQIRILCKELVHYNIAASRWVCSELCYGQILLHQNFHLFLFLFV